MEKRFLKNMNFDELLKLFNEKPALKYCFYNVMVEQQAYFLIEEYMKNFPGYYEVGGVYRGKVEIGRFGNYKQEDFVCWLEDAQENYCFLGCEKDYLKIANRWKEMQDKIDIVDCGYYDMSSKNYNMLESRSEELRKTLENAILLRLESEIDSFDDTEVMVDVFLSCYAESCELYLDIDGKIKEHIEYTEEIA